MIRDFFYLRKSDRTIILGLLSVIAIALAVLFLTEKGETPMADSFAGDSLETGWHQATSPRYNDERLDVTTGLSAELFPFDPNTADSSQLRRLGLPRWQIRNLYKYRQVGGVFRRPEDFAKLYGMTVSQYKRLRPYIHIKEDFRPATVLLGTSPDTVARQRLYPEKMKEGETLDLNLADTAQLCQVPGIGPYFARRIVAYGQRLGGYVKTDQLDEIEDFPAGAKSFLVVQHPSPRQLNVNRLSVQELKRHPYLNYYQAKAIVDYRRQHGPLRSLQDLSLLKDFPPEAIQRLEPYVCY